VLLQTNSFEFPGLDVFGIADMQSQAEWMMSRAQQDWGAVVQCNVKLGIAAAGGSKTVSQIKIDAERWRLTVCRCVMMSSQLALDD